MGADLGAIPGRALGPPSTWNGLITVSMSRKAAVGVWHASCTCRMGDADDPMAVTDVTGRVRGVEGLRVVDASIFSVVPRANTNFPTLMVAEKCAQAVLDGG